MNVAAKELVKRRRILATAAFLALASVACGQFETSLTPSFGHIRVVVVSSGGDFDADGFIVAVDAGQTRVIGTHSMQQSYHVRAGTHGVTLDGIAENCSVQGGTTRTVLVEVAAIVDVKFEIVCVPTGIAITTRTTGVDAPSALVATVSGQSDLTIPPNGSHTVGRLTAGNYTVTLSVPAHCTVSGGGQAVVTVAARTVTTVPFDVTCVAVARLEKIAFVNNPNPSGLGNLTLVNVDGTTPLVLGVGHAPTWSPDGKLLASSTTSCDDGGWYYYGFCVGGLVLLDPETGNSTSPSAGLWAFHPAWSPNGQAIALAFQSGGDSSWALRVLFLSANTVRTLSIAGPVSNEQPTWSPDGQRIAFVCRWTANTDLCVVNADGGALVRLTNDAPVDLNPKWSPDGRTIAYARHPAGRTDAGSGEIVLLDVATRQLTVLTSGTDPAWSRDGSRIVFARDDGLFVIGANGANLARLTTGSHRAPAWRP